jgi:hypothetical protein
MAASHCIIDVFPKADLVTFVLYIVGMEEDVSMLLKNI